jgi:hypothetical protein
MSTVLGLIRQRSDFSLEEPFNSGLTIPQDLALIIDAANQVLSLQAGEDQKKWAVITNSRARRRERQGAGLKVAAAATTTAKAQVKPALAKPAPAPAPVAANIKEGSKPAQPGPTTAEKASAAPTLGKKSAAPLKRGASSGIMQAFSKATPKVKKEADTPETTTPSGENPNMQPLSDDGEDDEEMPQPQPKANAASDLKSRKQREEELRRMMEEDDEEEESPEKAEDESAEEPMEEEPPAPEPAKKEAPEIVTASTNGRRRGKRRVMRKKQIMDDQGYLGTPSSTPQACILELTLGHSHNPGTRVGVFLRRRASSAHQAKDDELGAASSDCQTKEEWAKRKPGKHHVLLLQEVIIPLCGLPESFFG